MRVIMPGLAMAIYAASAVAQTQPQTSNSGGSLCYSQLRRAVVNCSEMTLAEQRTFWPSIARCGFRTISTWRGEANRHQEIIRTEDRLIAYLREELRWNNHDITNGRFLPSETVRSAMEGRQMQLEFIRASEEKIATSSVCAEYAALRAGGKGEDDALRELASRSTRR
jgi:hypothetical protein